MVSTGDFSNRFDILHARQVTAREKSEKEPSKTRASHGAADGRSRPSVRCPSIIGGWKRTAINRKPQPSATLQPKCVDSPKKIWRRLSSLLSRESSRFFFQASLD